MKLRILMTGHYFEIPSTFILAVVNIFWPKSFKIAMNLALSNVELLSLYSITVLCGMFGPFVTKVRNPPSEACAQYLQLDFRSLDGVKSATTRPSFLEVQSHFDFVFSSVKLWYNDHVPNTIF